MLIASTYKGLAVSAFPDVCKTPGGSPVPIPYPNMAKPGAGINRGTTNRKSTAIKGVVVKKSSGNDAGALKGQLTALHGKIMSMSPGNATEWHKALDAYVIKSAEVYRVLSSND